MKYGKLVSGIKNKVRSQKSEAGSRKTKENVQKYSIDFLNFKGFSIIAFSFILCFFLFPFSLFSQEPEEIDPMPIRLKGQILNLEDETPVPFATILNFRTHGSVIADDQGRFTIEMMNVDSLAISSLGFSKITARVPANYNEMNVLIIYAKPVRFSLQEVKVQGDKQKVNLDGLPPSKKLDIDPALRGDAYNKKPPVIAAFFNPASYLHYYLSKSERDKRETRKAILTEKQWNELSEFYNKKLVMELTGLNEPQADWFMMYINSKDLLSQMKTEYDARAIIREQFKIYKEEGH
ncbi:MAG TPA: hypothetical protein DCR40_05840 [Prolixibacteraceae bacterium]|nr:hypothetical protein [Prolixibacteraceae bacterium]